MVTLHRVKLTSDQLNGIPGFERRMLILIAHAFNELNILSKLFHYAASAEAADPILLGAENAQALVLARNITGKIYECWKLLQKAFFGTALSKTYYSHLDAGAIESLDALKRYFNRENAIAAMRNEFAFHYSPDQIDAGQQAVVERDSLDVYLAKEDGNRFFAFAGTIAGRAMLERIKPGNPSEAFEALMQETSSAVQNLNNVISSLMAISFEKHFGVDFVTSNATAMDMEGAPNSVTLRIPYFIEFDVQ
jgi:hypothetical protein